MTIDTSAFELIHASGARIALDIAATQINRRTAVVLTFRGHGIIGGSLFNGDYTLIGHGDKVRNHAGTALDGDNDAAAGGHYREEFFRRFGDSDGDGDLDHADRHKFLSTPLRRPGHKDYLWYFDWNDDGRIALTDLLAFTVASLGLHR